MSDVTVLKLGGSVITVKDNPETLDGPALARAADAIADDDGALVLVHGGGSFGHYHADRHGVTVTEGTHDAGEAMDVHRAMTTLNSFVLDRLHGRGVPALPVHPLSAGSRTRAGDLDFPTSQVETMLAEGFVPVLHGDGVAHESKGVTVLSGDEIVAELANSLDAHRVGMCSTVPGVLDADGQLVETIVDFDSVADVLGDSQDTDVTGGMTGKVRTLSELDASASVFDLDGLESFLAGGSPGTTIE